MFRGLVFDAIKNAYVPWLFERLKRDQIEEKMQIVLWTYAYCVVLICIAGMAFIIGGPFLVLVAGKEYSAASEVVGWLALGQAFNGMYLMVTIYAFYSKRTGSLSLSTIIAGLTNIGLLYVLINEMGLQGAAVAYAVSMALKFFMTWFVANLCHPMTWFEFDRSN
jgi:O-antigen/teichoic acid export membrane protein